MKQYKLLLVDDETNILRSLTRALQKENYQIFSAGDANTALKMLDNDSYDIIISDNRMPLMDGIDLLKIVKGKYPQTIRVMLSGYSEFDSIVKAINEAEVSKFISKPWDNDELRSLIASLIEINWE